MSQFSIKTVGFKELEQAIKRNPVVARDEFNKFLIRGLAHYKRSILNNPWRMGASGGGAPVDTGNLKNTHKTQIKPFEGSIFPTVKYAPYVHEGTKRMAGRPWLDYVKEKEDKNIDREAENMLEQIVKKLAK